MAISAISSLVYSLGLGGGASSGSSAGLSTVAGGWGLSSGLGASAGFAASAGLSTVAGGWGLSSGLGASAGFAASAGLSTVAGGWGLSSGLGASAGLPAISGCSGAVSGLLGFGAGDALGFLAALDLEAAFLDFEGGLGDARLLGFLLRFRASLGHQPMFRWAKF